MAVSMYMKQRMKLTCVCVKRDFNSWSTYCLVYCMELLRVLLHLCLSHTITFRDARVYTKIVAVLVHIVVYDSA
jgi:hypothetical protein